MQTRKLLIAESSDELRQALTDSLSERYHICACGSGDRALELLRNFSPDIIYIDLMLPQMDGIAVLQAAAREGIHPTVLAAVSFDTPYINNALSRLQIGYVVRRPCAPSIIAGHIDELSGIGLQQPLPQTDLAAATAALLNQLGMGNNLSGFQYLVTAMPMFLENPRQALTKELYPAIGKPYGKHWTQVERSIRNAIETAWNRRNERVWQRYFTPSADGTIPRPTNGQMLHSLHTALCDQGISQKYA